MPRRMRPARARRVPDLALVEPCCPPTPLGPTQTHPDAAVNLACYDHCDSRAPDVLTVRCKAEPPFQ